MPEAPKGNGNQPMHAYLKEGADLANTYAEDGAYHRAAELYTEVAKEARKHSRWLKAQGL